MTKNSVDNAIMEAVFEDDHTTGTLKTKNTFIVATGMWRLYEDDTIAYILYTDDYADDRVWSAVLKEDCELIEASGYACLPAWKQTLSFALLCYSKTKLIPQMKRKQHERKTAVYRPVSYPHSRCCMGRW